MVRGERHRLHLRAARQQPLDRLGDEAADDIGTHRALEHKPALRGSAETRYQAKSWNKERRVFVRIEATTKGLDIRFVITSIHTGSAEHVYALKRQRWRAAYLDWIADGRPDYLVLEPTVEGLGREAGEFVAGREVKL